MATKKITELTAVTTPTGADVFPIVQSGVTYKATRAQNASVGADIASAATTDIGAATGEYLQVTGTTTITALGTVASGTKRIVRFTGILTLTHNATSLILPNSTNITTIANDVAEFISLGSGNWICSNYQRADGRSIKQVKGADIASAATTDIGAATGEYVEVTGTTTITALGTVASGTKRTVRFTGALTLTHNATSLILPTAANIITIANDTAEFISLGSGNWICTNYSRKTIDVLQIAESVTGAVATGATQMVLDNSIPENTEGDQYLTVSITPKNTNNTLYIEAQLHCSHNDGTAKLIAALFQDTTVLALAATAVTTGTNLTVLRILHKMTAGTTSPTTFKVRAGANVAGSTTINGSAGAQYFANAYNTFIRVTETS